MKKETDFVLRLHFITSFSFFSFKFLLFCPCLLSRRFPILSVSQPGAKSKHNAVKEKRKKFEKLHSRPPTTWLHKSFVRPGIPTLVYEIQDVGCSLRNQLNYIYARLADRGLGFSISGLPHLLETDSPEGLQFTR